MQAEPTSCAEETKGCPSGGEAGERTKGLGDYDAEMVELLERSRARGGLSVGRSFVCLGNGQGRRKARCTDQVGPFSSCLRLEFLGFQYGDNFSRIGYTSTSNEIP